MVNDGEDAVISSTPWQSSDQVYGYLRERGHVTGYSDLIEWYAGSMCEVLVLLADCAPLDIFLNPCSPSRPTEVFEDLSYCFVVSQVCC